MAVSYPGVGRFRRAETGILGRAIKGAPLGLPFYLGIGALGRLSRTVNLASGPKEPAGRRRYGMARSLKFAAQAAAILPLRHLKETTIWTQQFVRGKHSLP